MSKTFLIIALFSLVSSSVLPYYSLRETDNELVTDSTEEKDAEEKKEKKEEKEEKKEKIRDNINTAEYSFSQKEIRHYNFRNFHFIHFQKVETPPPEFIV